MGVRAKIFRSRDHLNALNHEIGAFLDRNPYELVSDFEAQNRTYTYRAKAKEEVPLLIRVLVGEVLNQLRSSLDHLAWQLALLTVSHPPESTEFPIFKDAAAYARYRQRKIGALPSAAQTIIDRLQPHTNSDPANHPLWILHRLANDDKHRLLHVVGAALQGITVLDSRGRDMWIDMTVGPFNDKTEIGHVRLENPSETDMEVQVHIAFDLAFSVDSAAKGRFIRPELAVLGQTIEKVVRDLRSFFP